MHTKLVHAEKVLAKKQHAKNEYNRKFWNNMTDFLAIHASDLYVHYAALYSFQLLYDSNMNLTGNSTNLALFLSHSFKKNAFSNQKWLK